MRSTVALVVMALLVSTGYAERILDNSFFDDRTHNKITFNIDGDGNKINLGKGGAEIIPEDEYQEQGLARWFASYWVHDSNEAIDELLEQIASSPIYSYVSATGNADIDIRFDPPVMYYGTWVLHNIIVDRPSFKAYDAQDKLIETARFDDDAVDGTILDGEVEYGFLGINADRPIARLEVPEGVFACDDFYLAPEPSAALMLLLAGAGALRKR